MTLEITESDSRISVTDSQIFDYKMSTIRIKQIYERIWGKRWKFTAYNDYYLK